MNKTLILLPTIDENRNIKKLFYEIKNLNLKLDYIFIDDASVDGTKHTINNIVNKNKNQKIYFINNNCRKGIGFAHKFAINFAYKKKYDFLFTMDTDFAHKPKYLIELEKYKKKSDFIVGSRYLKKNSTIKISKFRKFLSFSSHIVAKLLFGHNLDSTNSFRCYNLCKIERQLFKKIHTNDYDFFFTSINLLRIDKYKIKQIPMKIYNRSYGGSKMTLKHIIKSIINIFILFFKVKLNLT